MSYFRFIDNGNGPTKLFIGGLHGNEGKTSIKLLKSLKKEDFHEGQIFIYNFDESRYISTLKKEYYQSSLGLKIIDLIKKIKPDFYTELHCYNIDHFKSLIGDSRRNLQGVPPLIDCGDYILISSVSPQIRLKYFSKETICKTLEIPCIHDNEKIKYAKDIYGFNKKISVNRYMDIIKLIAKSKNRIDFENKISYYYPHQVDLARIYVKEIFGDEFPPF